MRLEIWQGIYDMIQGQGLLDAPVEDDQIYTLEFLQEIYGGEQ